MKKHFDKGSAEMNMFRDFYALSEQFWIAEDSESYWESLVITLNEFCKKYKSIPIASKLAITFSNAKEREIKEQKERR